MNWMTDGYAPGLGRGDAEDGRAVSHRGMASLGRAEGMAVASEKRRRELPAISRIVR
jgi:hypothetical protein